MRSPAVDFLTDSEPRKWDRNQLAAPARSVVEDGGPPRVREWFTSAYALALALLVAGDAASAADLMEVCIREASDLAETDPDAIELGVEAWLNRVELERTTTGDAAYVDALEASYGLLTGAPTSAHHLFGLAMGRMGSAGAAVRRRALNAARNRVQASLLKQLLRVGDEERALRVAERIARDFPGAVRHGMLEPVEVIAMLAPRHALLDDFAPLEPVSEGDFVVHLRLWDSSRTEGVADDLRRCDLGGRLSVFEASHSFRNPCTPWLWRVHHSFATGDEEGQRVNVSGALREAVRRRDLRSHQRVLAQAGRRLDSFPDGAAFVEGTQPDRAELVGLAEGLLAVRPLSIRTSAHIAQERASIQPCHL